MVGRRIALGIALVMGLAFGQPVTGQSLRDVTPMILAFGQGCSHPEASGATFDRDALRQALWQARGLIITDILEADGPGRKLIGFIFDTDRERFVATFPEFAQPATFAPRAGWRYERRIEMTRWRSSGGESDIARPMLLCAGNQS